MVTCRHFGQSPVILYYYCTTMYHASSQLQQFVFCRSRQVHSLQPNPQHCDFRGRARLRIEVAFLKLRQNVWGQRLDPAKRDPWYVNLSRLAICKTEGRRPGPDGSEIGPRAGPQKFVNCHDNPVSWQPICKKTADYWRRLTFEVPPDQIKTFFQWTLGPELIQSQVSCLAVTHWLFD